VAGGAGGGAKEKSKMTLNEQKDALRKIICAELKNISPKARNTASAQLRIRLVEQSFWKNAASVLFFAPLPDEIDLWPLLEKSTYEKNVALPSFDDTNQFYKLRQVKDVHREIVSGQFGIREPNANCVQIPFDNLDLILVPGVAFDLRGNRLGRGRGFYDRLLRETRGLKCGVAFDEQVVGEVPVEAHDLLMDFILTPTRCVETGK
jgi:5-formyltetrahydrofolate cyclo-ligase